MTDKSEIAGVVVSSVSEEASLKENISSKVIGLEGNSKILLKQGSNYQINISELKDMVDGEHLVSDAEGAFSVKFHLQSGQLKLEIIPSSASVSLIGDLKFSHLTLESTGIVNLALSTENASSLDIKANKLIVEKPLNDFHRISLASESSVIVTSAINAKTLDIRATKIVCDADITADSAQLIAKEALALKGLLTVENLSLGAASLVQSGTVVSDKLEIKASKKMINRGRIIARNHMKIEGDVFVNNGHCYSPNTLSLDVKKYEAEAGSSFRAQNLVQIVADKWVNRGECIADHNAFIKVGHIENKATISCGEEFYFHVKSLKALPGSQLTTLKAEGPLEAKSRRIEIDRNLDVSKDAKIELNAVHFSAYTANVYGEISANDSAISLHNCIANEGSSLELTRVELSCAKQLNLKEASTCKLESAVIKTSEQIINGHLIARNKSYIQNEGNAELRSKAVVELDASAFKSFRLNNFGKMQLAHQSLFDVARVVSLQDGSSLTVEDNSQLNSANSLVCMGAGVTLSSKDSLISSKKMELAGNLHFDHSRVQAAHATVTTDLSATDTLVEISESLSLKGSESKADLKGCVVKTKHLELEGKLKCDHSKLDSEHIVLHVKSELHLQKVAHIDSATLRVMKDAVLTSSERSVIKSKVVMADGTLQCEDSSLITDRLDGVGRLNFKLSKLKVSGWMLGAGKLKLENSKLDADSMLMTGHYDIASSKLTSNYLREAGSGVFTESDVDVLEQHSVARNAKVLLEGKTYLSPTGKVLLEGKTNFSSKTTQSEGDVTVLESVFHSKNLIQNAGRITLEKAKLEVEALAISLAGSAYSMKDSRVSLEQASLAGSMESEHSLIEANDLRLAGNARLMVSELRTRGHLSLVEGNHEIKYSSVKAASASIASDALISGSLIESEKELVISGDAKVHDSKMKVDSMTILGRLAITNVALTAREIAVHNHLLSDSSQIAVDGKFELFALGVMDSNESEVSAKRMSLNGRGVLKSARLKAEEGVDVGSTAKFKADALEIITAGTAEFDCGASLEAEALSIKADTVSNWGNLSAKTMKVDAEWLMNHGRMSAERLKIEVNKVLYNSVGAELTGSTTHIIAGAMVNVAGHVNGSNTLTTSSLANFNVGGLYSGFNVYNSSLLGVNAGLMLPSIPTNWDALADPMRWVRMASMVATTCVPQYGAAIGLATSAVPLLWSAGKTVRAGEVNKRFADGAQALRTAASRMLTMPTDLWYGNVKIKDCVGVTQIVSSVVSSLVSAGQSINAACTGPSHPFSSELEVSHPEEIALSATVFAPTAYNSSAFSFDGGISASGSLGTTGFYSFKNGADAGVMVTNTSGYIFNGGQTAGYAVTYSAESMDNYGRINAERLGVSIAEDMHNARAASIEASRGSFQVGGFQSDGALSLREGSFVAEHFVQGQDAHSDLGATNLNLGGASIDGELRLAAAHMAVRNELKLEQASHVLISDTGISAGATALNGQLDATGGSLNSTALLSVGEAAQVHATGVSFNAADASLAGSVDLAHSALTAGTIGIEAGGSLAAKEGTIATAQTLAIKGHGHAEFNGSTAAVGETLSVETDASLAARDSALEAARVGAAGTMDLAHSALSATQEIRIDAGGSLREVEGAIATAQRLVIDDQGRVELSASSAAIKEVLSMRAGASLAARDSVLEAARVDAAGAMDLAHSSLTAEEEIRIDAGGSLREIEGAIATAQSLVIDDHGHAELSSSSVAIKEAISMRAGASLAARDSVLDAARVDAAGTMDLAHSALTATQEIRIDAGGSLREIEGAIATAQTLVVDGHAQVELSASSAVVKEAFVAKENSTTTMENSLLEAGSGVVKGKMNVEHSDIKAHDDLSFAAGSEVATRDASMTAANILAAGKLKAEQTYIEGRDRVDMTGAVFTDTVGIKAREINHSADHAVRGDLILEATQFNASASSNIHQLDVPADVPADARVVAPADAPADISGVNRVTIKADAANLEGHIRADGVDLEVLHLANASELVEGVGAGARIEAAQSFALATQDAVAIGEVHRAVDLSVRATAVSLQAGFNDAQHDLTLIATEGDANIQGRVNANNLAVAAARDITNTAQITAAGDATFEAKGIFRTIGADIAAAGRTTVVAQEVDIITRGSEAFTHLAEQGVAADAIAAAGAGGSLSGGEVLVEATAGDVNDYGGAIQSTDYTQIVASGNIRAVANQESYRAQFGTRMAYSSALISGGAGREGDEHHVGVYMSAGDKVIVDASIVVGDGTVYINSKKGLESTARSNTYISNHSVKKGIFSKKETTTWSTEVCQSTLASTGGKVIIRAEEGGVTMVGTAVATAQGTEIDVRDTVHLAALVVEERSVTNKHGFLNLTSSSRRTSDELAVETVVADMDGITIIHSQEGDVIAEGASFVGEADLTVEATKGSISMSALILNHEERIKQQKFFVDSAAFDMAKTAVTNPSALPGALNPLAAALSNTIGAEHPVEKAAALTNLMVEAAAARQSLKEGSFFSQLGKKMSMLQVGFTSSTMEAHYQTKSDTVISRHDVSMIAMNSISLSGVDLNAANASFSAKNIKFEGKTLESDFKQTQRSMAVSLSVLPSGVGVEDASLSTSHAEGHSTTSAHEHINVAGELSLNAESCVFDGASADVGSIVGHVESLELISCQDSSHFSASSASASASGMASYSSSTAESRLVGEVTRLHSHAGINQNAEHAFVVGKARSVGAVVSTDSPDVNHFNPAEFTAEELHDFRRGSSSGFSANVAHVADALMNPDDVLSPAAGSSAFENVSITTGKEDYRATNESTVTGGLDGTAVSGHVNRSSVIGPRVERDTSYSATFEVPVGVIARAAQAVTGVAEAVRSKIESSMASPDLLPPSAESPRSAIPSAMPPSMAKDAVASSEAESGGSSLVDDTGTKPGVLVHKDMLLMSEDIIRANMEFRFMEASSSLVETTETSLGLGGFDIGRGRHYEDHYTIASWRGWNDSFEMGLALNLASLDLNNQMNFGIGHGDYSSRFGTSVELMGLSVKGYVQKKFKLGDYLSGMFRVESEAGFGAKVAMKTKLEWKPAENKFSFHSNIGFFAGSGSGTKVDTELHFGPEVAEQLTKVEDMRDSHSRHLST